MTTAVAARTGSPLGDAVLAHLQVQLESAGSLLQAVIAQGRAVRLREVETVLARMADMQAESERRGRLERERTVLLTQAAGILGIPPHTVTLDALCTLLDPGTVALARERSAQLRGTLDELQQQHAINRALMKQELAFVEHLTRLLAGGAGHDDPDTYGRPGDAASAADGRGGRAGIASRPPALRALNLEA
ncbi:MAG: flagellar protein FlgN [Solirubrobacterales bacterium]|nr:flagellar protein FlgN [Solirubrobacterales bacterium]